MTFLVDADTKSRYSSCETGAEWPAVAADDVLAKAKAGADEEYVKEEIAGGDVAKAVRLKRDDQDAVDAEGTDDRLGLCINETLGCRTILSVGLRPPDELTADADGPSDDPAGSGDGESRSSNMSSSSYSLSGSLSMEKTRPKWTALSTVWAMPLLSLL